MTAATLLTEDPVPGSTDAALRVAEMPDDALHEFFLDCRRRERVAAAEAAAALAEIDRRRSFMRERFLSASSFVAWRAGDSHRAAAGLVRTARALQRMPHTAAAFERGEIDTIRVRRLVDAREAAPDAFIADEDSLVERAREQDAATFVRTVELWQQNQAPDHSRRRERERFEARRLGFADRFDGMVAVDALLDPVSAETVITAVRALAGPADRDGADGRTSPQRRADALTQICRRFLDTGDAPISGGQKPHLNVIVDIDGLTGGPVYRSEIGHGRPLGPAAREFLACDATVCGVVMEGPWDVLQMGRRVRVATPAQLRALAVRDGGCVVPGCDRPPDWCDAHHLVPWVHGGLTDVDEMCLLCRPHHVMLHFGSLALPDFLIERRTVRHRPTGREPPAPS
jgi:hypothetical protein